MSARRWLVLTTLLVVALCPLLGQSTTLTLTVSGTLGPVLSGNDRWELNGRPVVLTITTSESLSPLERNTHAVEYQLTPSDVAATVSGTPFSGYSTPTSTGPIVAAVFTPEADIGVLSGVLQNDISTFAFAQIRGTIFLKPGSWNKTVLEHITAFSPSPQNITAATSPTGPGSKLEVDTGGATIYGLTGTASSTN
jgi:hypothetical protein